MPRELNPHAPSPSRSLARGFAAHALFSLTLCLTTTACKAPVPVSDHPHLTPKVRLIDTQFPSATLDRNMHLRLILPETPRSRATLPVVYLLHGAGTDYRDWASNSDICALAAKNIVLVMPDARDSYYINEATGTNRRYEDYIIHDVVPEVHRLLPNAASDRAHTAIVGISRGGFGALAIGLRHPGTFGFIGDLSGAVDFRERRFRYRAPLQSFGLERVFGPEGSITRRSYDPFLLAHANSAQSTPYIFIACGDQDPLFAPNQRLGSLLKARGIPHEFHAVSGGHNWTAWNEEIPLLESALLRHIIPREEGSHP